MEYINVLNILNCKGVKLRFSRCNIHNIEINECNDRRLSMAVKMEYKNIKNNITVEREKRCDCDELKIKYGIDTCRYIDSFPYYIFEAKNNSNIQHLQYHVSDHDIVINDMNIIKLKLPSIMCLIFYECWINPINFYIPFTYEYVLFFNCKPFGIDRYISINDFKFKYISRNLTYLAIHNGSYTFYDFDLIYYKSFKVPSKKLRRLKWKSNYDWLIYPIIDKYCKENFNMSCFFDQILEEFLDVSI